MLQNLTYLLLCNDQFEMPTSLRTMRLQKLLAIFGVRLPRSLTVGAALKVAAAWSIGLMTIAKMFL